MISIYCLVNPETNKPFYVGATKCKLKTRLSMHINEAQHYYQNEYGAANKKQALIKELISKDIKPLIHLLHTTDINSVDFYEQFYFLMLQKQGFEMMQISHGFNYKKLTTNFRYSRPENMRIIVVK